MNSQIRKVLLTPSEKCMPSYATEHTYTLKEKMESF